MPAFRYVAIEPSGALARGTMEAPDQASVIEQLRRAGNLPVSAAEATRGSALVQLLQTEIGGGRALSRQQLAEAIRELATMLGAGQDLDRALRYLVETAPNRRVGAVFGRVRDAVRDGGTLAGAMAAEPRSFPKLLVGLVRAGEAGGALAATLERLAVLFERERSLVATVRTAMVYPVMLLIAAVGSVTLLLTRVLPEFVPLFAQNGVALPQSTRSSSASAPSWPLTGPMPSPHSSCSGSRPARRCAGRAPAPPPTPCCSAFNVNVDNSRVLNDITLSVEPGTIHALMGPNGSGKNSSLMYDHGASSLSNYSWCYEVEWARSGEHAS